mgnify:CR=1 FL=1
MRRGEQGGGEVRSFSSTCLQPARASLPSWSDPNHHMNVHTHTPAPMFLLFLLDVGTAYL